MGLGRNSTKQSFRDYAARVTGISAETAPDTDPAPAHRPPTWDDYIGQAHAKRRLKVAIASALARDHRAEHMMLTGGAGAGKTTLARLIAMEMDRLLVILTKPPTKEELRRACEKAEFGVLFVDEIHCWSDAMQSMLMELTESGTLDSSFGPQDFRYITVIAATTEADQLLEPLLDRFTCKVELDSYSVDDLTIIGMGMAERCWPDGYEPLDIEDCAVLAVAAAGVPRNLRALIHAGRDLVHAGEEPTPQAILDLCDTDPDGCTRAHLAVLAQLAKSTNGMAGLATLASLLRVPAGMLRRTERLLVDREYIHCTPSGRVITPKGRARLADGSIRENAA